MSERLTILVIVGTRTDEYSLRNQAGMGSESDCLLGQFERTLWVSDSEAGLQMEKSVGVVEGEGECGDDVEWLLSRDSRSLDIWSVKKEAKLSASEIPGVEEGKGDGDLRCKSLLSCVHRPFSWISIVSYTLLTLRTKQPCVIATVMTRSQCGRRRLSLAIFEPLLP